MSFEWSLFWALLGMAAALLIRSSTAHRAAWALAIALVAAAAASAAFWNARTSRSTRSAAELRTIIPTQRRSDGYVSSDKCRSCHPSQYETWHATFHRTMTQVAGERTVVGDFENVTLEFLGKTYRLSRRGNEFWVDMEDPEWRPAGTGAAAALGQADVPRVQRRIGLLTGSHHMQAYWMAGTHGNLQTLFPFAWLIPERRWVPFHNTFLRDPNMALIEQHWNVSCINCHATGGQPRPDSRTLTVDTRVGELGIACEACHGEASAHVSRYHNPLRRYQPSRRDRSDPTIVNPEKQPPQIGSQICGQCHGIKWIRDRREWEQIGFRYRPGQELAQTTPVVQPTRLKDQPWLDAPLKQSPRYLDDRFWRDGMVRVSGREYNGLLESPCYQRGEMSCLSCHSMHKSDPNDQLAKGRETNEACFQCHQTFRQRLTEHTHHAANSSGSLCYNCHMPHTTYGLMKAIRSHQISNPTIEESLQTGRPNACNLCHLDRSLGWTQKQLESSWGRRPVELSEEQKATSAAVIWALKGDAGQRALIAWSMGWDPAQAVSSKEWLPPYLAQLLDDPYSTVRYIAHRSLKTLGAPYDSLAYDFVGPDAARRKARDDVISAWQERVRPGSRRTEPELLFRTDGSLRRDVIDRLLVQRDNRSMDLQE